MTRPAGWRRIFRLWQHDPARDVDAELSFHFDQRIADLVARGVSANDARAQAEREFGDRNAVRDGLVAIDVRLAERKRKAEWWDAVLQDLGYAVRGLRRSPRFAAMVILTLALGLGANAAIFSVLERLFWRNPAGVNAPNTLRRVQLHVPAHGEQREYTTSVFNYPQMQSLSGAMRTYAPLAGFRSAKTRFGRDATAPAGALVSVVGDYFGVIGVQPAAGRFFTANEIRPDAFEPLVVISSRLATAQFGSPNAAVGQALDLRTHRYTVIGVVPDPFHGLDLDAADAWIPMNSEGNWAHRDTHWYTSRNTLSIHLITRVADNARIPAIESVASRVFADTTQMFAHSTAALTSVIESVWPDGGRKELTTATRLAGVAAIILLIACANVANLLLARGLSRRREIAVRLALGVRRRRLIAQLLTESLLLALAGGIATVFVAAWAAMALKHSLLPNVTWGDPLLDYRIVAFTIALSCITGIVAGLAPALRASNPDILASLKTSARDGGGGPRSRVRTTLLVAQTALSIVLLAAAGLFVRSLSNIQHADIGYDANRLLYASVGYDAEGSAHGEEIGSRLPDLAERLAHLDGVEAVGMTVNIPFEGIGFADIGLPGPKPAIQGGWSGSIVMNVSPGFFAAVGTKLVRGRDFTPADRIGTRPVIVVNSTLARKVWPGEEALGKCLIVDEMKSPCREVVGVVADAHYSRIIEDESAQLYVPLAQDTSIGPRVIVLRTGPGRSVSIVPAVQSIVRNAFAGWAIPRTKSMAEVIEPEVHPWRLSAAIFAAAGLLALLVAAVGVYSTVSYTVSQRTHEMGVRVALGARGADITRLVLGEGLRVVAIGVVLGAALALALGKVIASMLYSVSPRDPANIAAVSFTLLGVAAIACLIPALRATRVDPARVLRE